MTPDSMCPYPIERESKHESNTQQNRFKAKNEVYSRALGFGRIGPTFLFFSILVFVC